MDGRQDVQRKSERLFKSQRGLIVALVLICLVIVGLVASIIVINITKVRQNDETSGEMESFNVEGDKCSTAASLSDMEVCIDKEYMNAQMDYANNMYERRISKALSDKNYDLFTRLLGDKVYAISEYGVCAQAYAYLDNYDVSVFPDNVAWEIYSIGYETSIECEDEEKAKFYDDKMNEINLVITGDEDGGV